ncbi:MAG: bis(5'-nucleosyl)-tetraphosphatase (symmetrical) YqeK [Lachnospiraceae bacterium]|nr:bis(5'-nucleosyl)-tetraphosphatase (symmetrical) YqeK [Lachnospiraceae bacterium]
MEKELDGKRYEHTLGVAYTAAALAMRYDVDIEAAIVAGLLHDCAKCLSDEKKLSICEKHHLNVSDVERKNPSLLHAKVGGFLAMEEYHIEDIDIINAILNHTTGRPGMSELEKIIFIADYMEPGRKNAPNLTLIRKLVYLDLDKALLKILEDTLAYLKESKQEVDLMTQKTYDFYHAEMY